MGEYRTIEVAIASGKTNMIGTFNYNIAIRAMYLVQDILEEAEIFFVLSRV